MLHRLATICIIAFWLTMTALLVRNEVRPDGSHLREVPIHHVLKLLFLHEQRSELKIYTDSTLIGYLRMEPHVDPATEARMMDFNGTMQLRNTGTPRQRLQWDGSLALDRAFHFRHLHLALSMSEPAPLNATIDTDPQRAHVVLKSNTDTISEHDFTLDEAGARGLLAQLGVDPALLATFAGAKSELQPAFRARQSSLGIRGERIETYLVTIEQSGQTLGEIHISQLGQVLHAKTPLGYTFAPDDVAP